MNRKVLLGAAALLLPASSILAVTAAGAKTSAPAKPTISSVSVTHTAAASLGLSSSQLGWDERATVVITGTGFYGVSDPTGANPSADNTNFVFSKLAQTKDSSGKVTGGPVQSVTVNSAHTEIDLVVQAPGGALQDTTKPGKASKLTVTLGTGGGSPGFAGGVVKATGPALVSNCGSLSALASAGTTYATDGSGSMVYPLTSTGSNAATDYFDVYLFGKTLCAPDVLGTGTSTWATNYPVTFAGAASTSPNHVLTTSKTSGAYGKGQLIGVGFSFPYTNAGQDLDVYGTTVVYSLPKGTKAAGCSADASNPDNITINSCTVSGNTVTVQTSSHQTYSAPYTVESPVIDITGITAKTSGTGAMTVTPVSTTSYISLTGACTPGPSGNCLSITFEPRMKSANVTYAPIKADVSAS